MKIIYLNDAIVSYVEFLQRVLTANEKAVEGIYILAGQKLAAPVKGLNIINGKKYFVK